MKIITYQSERYKNCPIYFRNFYNHFEYLVVIEGQIYTTHITIIPTLTNLFFYWLGLEPSKYSKQQEAMILKSLRRMAETTIDFVLDKDKKSK